MGSQNFWTLWSPSLTIGARWACKKLPSPSLVILQNVVAMCHTVGAESCVGTWLITSLHACFSMPTLIASIMYTDLPENLDPSVPPFSVTQAHRKWLFDRVLMTIHSNRGPDSYRVRDTWWFRLKKTQIFKIVSPRRGSDHHNFLDSEENLILCAFVQTHFICHWTIISKYNFPLRLLNANFRTKTMIFLLSRCHLFRLTLLLHIPHR